MDVEDQVLEEYDSTHINTSLMSHLHLLQLPSPSFSERLAHLCDSHGMDTVLSARFKPKNGLLEMDIPMDTVHHTFDRERSERFARDALPSDVKEEEGGRVLLDHQRLTGTCLPCDNGILVLGTMHEGTREPKQRSSNDTLFVGSSIHLTPILILPLSLDFGYLDAARAKAKVAGKKPIAINEDDEGKPVQIQFKKRETEEQMAARLNSYAYLQRQVDDEPWVALKLYPSQSGNPAFLASKLIDTDETSRGRQIPHHEQSTGLPQDADPEIKDHL